MPRNRSSIPLMLLMLLALIVLSSCAPAGGLTLNGTSWELNSMAGMPLIEGRSITLNFEAEEVDGNAGCNHYFGGYTLNSAGGLQFGMIGMTEMACLDPEGIMQQESTYLSYLGTVVKAVREGDQLMLDYSTENMYSEHIAKLVSWHRCYTRFWKQSVLYCDWRWPDFLNLYAPEKMGSTGEAEPKFLNSVTGKNFTFLDGMELGKKIWNLDHAIWTLQGRHRDMVHFADYIYSVPSGEEYLMPGRENGEWTYLNAAGRCIDREKFEEFKTRFYQLEGWAPITGYPTRSTLESLDLGYVADELEENGRLGEEQI